MVQQTTDQFRQVEARGEETRQFIKNINVDSPYQTGGLSGFRSIIAARPSFITSSSIPVVVVSPAPLGPTMPLERASRGRLLNNPDRLCHPWQTILENIAILLQDSFSQLST